LNPSKGLAIALLTFLFSFNLVSAAEPGSSEIYLYSGIFIIILILIWLGYFLESYFLHLFAGFMLIVTGIYTFINGAGYDLTWTQPTNQTLIVDGFTNWSSVGNGWVFYLSFALIGLGLYYFIGIMMDNVWGIKENKRKEEGF